MAPRLRHTKQRVEKYHQRLYSRRWGIALAQPKKLRIVCCRKNGKNNQCTTIQLLMTTSYAL
jgi:hypothetical protein